MTGHHDEDVARYDSKRQRTSSHAEFPHLVEGNSLPKQNGHCDSSQPHDPALSDATFDWKPLSAETANDVVKQISSDDRVEQGNTLNEGI